MEAEAAGFVAAAREVVVDRDGGFGFAAVEEGTAEMVVGVAVDDDENLIAQVQANEDLDEVDKHRGYHDDQSGG